MHTAGETKQSVIELLQNTVELTEHVVVPLQHSDDQHNNASMCHSKICNS